MKIFKLRIGHEWRNDQMHVVHRFHQICREHGSRAVWLPQSGMLVTTDKQETDKGYPYEEWLQEAKEKSNS